MAPAEVDRLFRNILADDRLPHVVDYLKRTCRRAADGLHWEKTRLNERLPGDVKSFFDDFGLVPPFEGYE